MKVLDARFVASATQLSSLPPPQRAEVAFAGRSNVGKSSLINTLCQRKKLVRTSSTPGCTRGINVFEVKLRTGEDAASDAFIDLVDLPGYGFARRSKAERKSWGPLMESFLSGRPGLRAVVIIVDVRRGLQDDDRQLIEYLEHIERPVLLAATKLDKVAKSKAKAELRRVQQQSGGHRVHGFSSVSGEGREGLWRRLLSLASVGGQESQSVRA